MKPAATTRSNLAVWSFAIAASAEPARTTTIQLLPAGSFRPTDGRPLDVPAYSLDAATARELIAQFDARRVDLVVDYEHQTLHTEKNGQSAPAAGWITALAWREPEGEEPGGLYATVEWTERAAQLIAAREYRYVSPVFGYDKSGRVTALLPPAIVNFPGLDILPELALAARARLPGIDADHDHQENPMDRTALIATLGLAADATDEQITAAVAALKAAPAAVADPTKFAPVETVTSLRTELETVSAALKARDIQDVIAPALADGRLLPAEEAWARSLAEKDIELLKQHLATRQPLAALKGSQTGGKPPAGGKGDEGELTEQQVAVCRAIGIKPDEFKQTAAVAV